MLWGCTTSNIASQSNAPWRFAQCVAIPATACKQSLLRLIVSFFSPFFSVKQNKVNSKHWGETNFEVPKKQKDVRDVFFFKITKKDDDDWNEHNYTVHELHTFIKYMCHLVTKNHVLSFSFAMDDMGEIFLRVLDTI